MRAPASDGTPGWPAWQRLGFRYVFVYWLVYAMSDPQGNPLVHLLGTVRFWLAKLAVQAKQLQWFDVDLTSWTGPAFEWLAILRGERFEMIDGRPVPVGWWRDVTTWLSEGSAALNEGQPLFAVFHQATGSGDTMHDWVKFVCIAIAAGVLTVLWSLFARARSHPRLGRWLHLGARWYVAFQMLGYGGVKIYSSQFGEPGMLSLAREIGDKSGMGMVWTFMGSSPAYEVFSGIGEVLGGLLLFHRRTALLGCFVTAGVMTNVAALNWLYDVPVKLYSAHLLLIAVLLMAPFAQRLWALFVSNRFSESVDLRVVRPSWYGWLLAIVGWLLAVGTIVQSHLRLLDMRAQRLQSFDAKPALYGRWVVEKMVLDGQEVPTSDSSRWEFLAIDRNKQAWSRDLLGTTNWFTFAEDLAAGTVTMAQNASGNAASVTEVWTIERGRKVTKVPDRAPRSLQDRNAMVDVERDSIVFKGRWNGRDLVLETVKKEFLLHRGFHLVQEVPFNR